MMPLELGTPSAGELATVMEQQLRVAVEPGSVNVIAEALYPHKMEGDRVVGADKLGAYFAAWQAKDPAMRWMKVTDTSTGEIVSSSVWFFYDENRPKPAEVDPDFPDDLWPTEKEKHFASEIWRSFMAPRRKFIREKELPIVCLHGMATAKQYWGQGAGTLQMREAMRIADEMRAQCTVEASPIGRWLYECAGFKTEGRFLVQAKTSEFAERGSGRPFWLVRDRASIPLE